MKTDGEFYLSWLKKYLNLVYLKNGVKFPYNPEEIYTSVAFHPKAMVVFLQLEDGADRWFEDEFWDEEALDDRDIFGF